MSLLSPLEHEADATTQEVPLGVCPAGHVHDGYVFAFRPFAHEDATQDDPDRVWPEGHLQVGYALIFRPFAHNAVG